MSGAIVTTGLRKAYNGKVIFDGLNLRVPEHSITAVVGPNGAGKSTLLNLIAGVVSQDSGRILVESFERFRFSYVFQNYRESLLPWKTNLENLAFPLQVQGVSSRERRKRARELLEKHRLGFLARGYPYELSGGQQQMLALMRALITKPDYLLLDEPFSSLDYENTLRMRNVLQKYYLEHKPTVFMVTHDIEEAVYLAHKIIVLSSRPASVIGEVTSELSYPRTLETLEGEDFHRVMARVLSTFRQTVRI